MAITTALNTMVLNKIGRWVECLFEEHKFVRRSLVLWAMFEANRIITHTISIMNTVDTASASVVAAIIGILSTVTVFYIKARETDGVKKDGN